MFKQTLFQEKFEDTKAIIRGCNTKKDRQYNGEKQDIDLQYISQKTNISEHEPN